MKNFLRLLAAFLLLTFIPLFASANTDLPYIESSTGMRGLWVTSVFNLDWPSRPGLTAAEHRAEINDILDRAAAQGINAVFVQVRPMADALYRSELFPWSHFLTGEQGVAPADGFDPLEYWITAARARGIEVHAWLNPYRVTSPNMNITNPANLAPNHPARLNPDLVILHGSSLLFDPGNPAARRLIVDGVRELLENYDLDGIHLDDYFYPNRNFADQATFARYGNGMDLYDWRRENVNILIRDLQQVTHEINPRASFGVSPFAIWQNNTTDPRGSATAGLESYHTHYADTRLWVLEGWIDYIVPQIYWIEGNPAACYEAVLTWWEALVRGTNVRLYVGLAPYREVEGRQGWAGQIVRQLTRNANSDVVAGSIFFRERFMRSAVGDAIGAFYAQHLSLPTTPQGDLPSIGTPPEGIVPIPTPQRPAPSTVRMDTLFVSQPSGQNRTVTDAAGFWFYGSAVAGQDVFVNGQLITDRTEEGFFSVFMPLVRGQNTFTFTQNGQAAVTRNITNNAPATPQPPATMDIAITNTFPAADEWASYGTTITLRATAPAGATVTAEINGQIIELTQSNPSLTATDTNRVAAVFSGSFTLNRTGFNTEVTMIGRPIYTMTWNGHTRTSTATGTIHQIGTYAPFFAEITAETAWIFPNATITGGSSQILLEGQIDRVTAISGDWLRIFSGGWVQREFVRTFTDETLVPEFGHQVGFLSEGLYVTGRYWDTIRWAAPHNTAVLAEFDGSTLIVSLGGQHVAPPVFHTPGGTLFSEIRIGTHNGAPAYFMPLRDGAILEGFYTVYNDGELQLILRHRRPLSGGNLPFEGFTFVIDAGHGGTDPGANGPMGPVMSEAVIVLKQADLITRELEALGATVIRSRASDVFYTLQERVDTNRRANPDMFISLHNNATAETTNATNIRGFTVWYRNPNSLPAAASFAQSMRYVNPNTNRSNALNQANFFVVRPTWAPAILLEASFMNNIHDFAWMINPARQEEYARAVVNALLAYYR